jgi:nesprin-1
VPIFLLKDVLKKCSTAVNDHKAYESRLANFTEAFSNVNEKSQKLSQPPDSQDLLEWLAKIDEVASKRHHLTTLLNTAAEAADVACRTTAAKGKEAIEDQLAECQKALDDLFTQLQQTERKTRNQISQWDDFEENSTAFLQWLQNAQDHLKGGMVLKSTLDEKKSQLQVYRNLLQDVKSKKPVLDDLQNKLQSLSTKENKTKHQEGLNTAASSFNEVLGKAQQLVENYEEIVSDHHQYTKAVMEASEWVTASLNTIEMWGDTGLERLGLHANLERLRGLQTSLPEEHSRIEEINVLGQKIIPNTAPSGQQNVQMAVESSAQEWLSLQAALQASIDGVEEKIKHWKEFEASKDAFMGWLKNLESKLHSIDLKSTLEDKSRMLDSLKEDHGQLKARELELDAITEKLQYISRTSQISRSATLNELTVLYQQVNQKIKGEVQKWQGMVADHANFESAFANCERWLGEKQAEVRHIKQSKLREQRDIDARVKAINNLIVSKDEGFRLVQATVEPAQAVLLNTEATGQNAIKASVASVQSQWNDLMAEISALKMNTDDSIQKWMEFEQMIDNLQKTLDAIDYQLEDLENSDASKKEQIERLKELDEKLALEQHDMRQVEAKVASLQQGESIPDDGIKSASSACQRFSALRTTIETKLAKAENEYKDIKAYRYIYIVIRFIRTYFLKKQLLTLFFFYFKNCSGELEPIFATLQRQVADNATAIAQRQKLCRRHHSRSRSLAEQGGTRTNSSRTTTAIRRRPESFGRPRKQGGQRGD